MSQTVIVFINEKDKSIEVLGKALISIMDKHYYVFTRMPSKYPSCSIENTMLKIKEVCSHSDDGRIIISFGCRVLPNNIKQIEKLAQDNSGNLVFLKKLRGSKTWRVSVDGELFFDNERIADCGLFIIEKTELMKTKCNNFNSFIRSLLIKRDLHPIFVEFYLFSN